MQVLLERGELTERVRVRVLFDLLSRLDPDAGGVARRSSSSRLHLGRVEIAWTGEASLTGDDGDVTGAALLAWEILAGRVAETVLPGRIHDLVDEIHPDVDDVIASALAGRIESIGELREALESASAGRVAEHTEVRTELGTSQPLPPPRPISPEQQAVLRASARPKARASSGAPPVPSPSTLTTPRSLALRPPPSDLIAARAQSGPASDRRPLPSAPDERASDSSPSHASSTPSDREPPPSSIRPTVLLVSMLEDEDGELAEQLRARGFDVAIATDAETGYGATCQLEPSCVVCDMDLPDDSGDTVVRRLRKLSSGVGTTPFILIASAAATSDRIARFSAGADICLLKPYVSADVVAQVLALHHMSSRLRKTREALSRFPKASSRAFNGHLDQISLAAILTIVDMERRTGVFQIRQGATQVDLSIICGYATRGVIQGRSVSVEDALLAMVRMEKGRFSFIARDGFAAVPEDAIRVGQALAEATRAHDEAAEAAGRPDSSDP